MHPIEVIEFLIVGAIIGTLASISLFLKGKWRKRGWLVTLVVFLAFCTLYVVRPYWIDGQIEKKVELLSTYLVQQYPGEEWTISTVPHREDGYESQSPYSIMVVFENEPEVSYYYWVKNKNNINQHSYSTNNGVDYELEHNENNW
ncbi:hypothetical protein [Paenisporosarcina indica]|uniref:hypothetical protein n=1 Tax=Paenisporosarcina indica TaxID=650093 RepID=UPI00094F8445|nr:hypothetical protein [Paenisporosarcina indica]